MNDSRTLPTELTHEEKRKLIAEACGKFPLFVLMKRGLYYRQNGGGYTGNAAEAWIVTEEESDKHVYPHDEPVTKHHAPMPDYFNDLNACHEMRKALVTPLLRSSFEFYLAKLVAEKCGLNQLYGEEPSPFQMIDAPSELQSEAFGQSMGLWK